MCAPTSSNAPYFNGLVGTGGDDGVSVLANKNRANGVGVSDELGDALPRPRIPQSNDALRAAASKDVVVDTQRIGAPLLGDLLSTDINLERLSFAAEVPEVNLAVETARGNPVRVLVWRRETLDVVGMLADGDRFLATVAVRSPYLDGQVGGGGDERAVVLG